MARIIKASELPELLNNMASYAEQCIGNGEDVQDYFSEIVATGLFSDSEGKVVNVTEQGVEVSTDY